MVAKKSNISRDKIKRKNHAKKTSFRNNKYSPNLRKLSLKNGGGQNYEGLISKTSGYIDGKKSGGGGPISSTIMAAVAATIASTQTEAKTLLKIINSFNTAADETYRGLNQFNIKQPLVCIRSNVSGKYYGLTPVEDKPVIVNKEFCELVKEQCCNNPDEEVCTNYKTTYTVEEWNSISDVEKLRALRKCKIDLSVLYDHYANYPTYDQVLKYIETNWDTLNTLGDTDEPGASSGEKDEEESEEESEAEGEEEGEEEGDDEM